MGRQLKTIFLLGLIMFTFHSGLQAQTAQMEDENAPTEAEFLKKNKTLQSLKWEGKHVLVLTLKTGKSEAFDLNSDKDRKRLYDKYGSYPQASPTGRVSRRRIPNKAS